MKKVHGYLFVTNNFPVRINSCFHLLDIVTCNIYKNLYIYIKHKFSQLDATNNKSKKLCTKKKREGFS